MNDEMREQLVLAATGRKSVINVGMVLLVVNIKPGADEKKECADYQREDPFKDQLFSCIAHGFHGHVTLE